MCFFWGKKGQEKLLGWKKKLVFFFVPGGDGLPGGDGWLRD